MTQFRIYSIAFEWDPDKATRNAAKHGVTFAEAATVFLDVGALDLLDRKHSLDEPRSIRLGRASYGAVLVVAYTRRSGPDGESIRIISARPASRRERAAHGPTD